MKQGCKLSSRSNYTHFNSLVWYSRCLQTSGIAPLCNCVFTKNLSTRELVPDDLCSTTCYCSALSTHEAVRPYCRSLEHEQEGSEFHPSCQYRVSGNEIALNANSPRAAAVLRRLRCPYVNAGWSAEWCLLFQCPVSRSFTLGKFLHDTIFS